MLSYILLLIMWICISISVTNEEEVENWFELILHLILGPIMFIANIINNTKSIIKKLKKRK